MRTDGVQIGAVTFEGFEASRPTSKLHSSRYILFIYNLSSAYPVGEAFEYIFRGFEIEANFEKYMMNEEFIQGTL